MDFASRRETMVDTQIRPSDVTKFPIINAMLRIPRETFVPRDKREAAYTDGNIDLGDGRTMLEPRTMGKMLDALDLQNSDLVLDLGAGYGYMAVIMAQIAQAVVAVESNKDMAQDAASLIVETDTDTVFVEHAELTEGAPQHGPYDVIVIEGGVETIAQSVIDQLKEGGRIAALFMSGPLGEVRVGHKVNGALVWRRAFNASAPVIEEFKAPVAFAL